MRLCLCMKHNEPNLYASGFVTKSAKTGVTRLLANVKNWHCINSALPQCVATMCGRRGTFSKRETRDRIGPGSQSWLQELNKVRNVAVQNVSDCKHTGLKDFIRVCIGTTTMMAPYLTRALKLRTTQEKFPKSRQNKSVTPSSS